MDRRSFLKGAAALAVAPAAVLPKSAPAAIPAAIDANLGTITAGATSIGSRLEICQRGIRVIDSNEIVRVVLGAWGESDGLGPIQQVVPAGSVQSA
jgi:hypothetical protein